MISDAQLRASRALLGIDQRKLAGISGLSLPTIQRMEASQGVIRGNVDSLMKLVAALDAAGVELIAENAKAAAAAAACGSRLLAYDDGRRSRLRRLPLGRRRDCRRSCSRCLGNAALY